MGRPGGMSYSATMLQPKEILDAGKDASTTLTSTVLGSLVVLLAIACGLLVWLLLKAKQSEIQTLKDVAEVSGKERVEAEKTAAARTKAYEDLAGVMNDGLEKVGKDVRDIERGLKEEIGKAIDASRSNGKRMDAIAHADQNVDESKYFERRGDT